MGADGVSVTVGSPDTDRLEVSTAAAAPARARAAIEEKAFRMASAGDGMGEARSALAPVPDTPAWQQIFHAHWVIWHPSFSACVLRRHSPVARLYAVTGGPSGYLGAPVTDETPFGTGTMCTFEAQGSAITWHPHLGARLVQGSIGEYWLDTGGPEGRWGFPTSDEYDAGNGLHAVDFEGGTLTWRRGVGIGQRPRPADGETAEWLVVLDEPPRRASGIGRASMAAGTPTMPTMPALRRANAEAAEVIDRVERCRALLDGVEPSPLRRQPDRLRTTVTPAEVRQFNTTPLPLGVTAEHLHMAQIALWRDLWSAEAGPSTIGALGGATLSWQGFVADGDLEFLFRTLFARCSAARQLLLCVGMSVEQVDGRFVFVAADVERGWRLYGVDAERLIRSDARLTTLLAGIAEGRVPTALLAEAQLPPEANDELRQATTDAQFLTVVSRAGRLPGWSLVDRWTRQLRAAVAHNLHVGCLTGWSVYEHTRGDPVEVVRAMAWDFFCGSAALLAQSKARFEGALSHGVLDKAARSFPPVAADDDGHARYIIAGGARRRVDASS